MVDDWGEERESLGEEMRFSTCPSSFLWNHTSCLALCLRNVLHRRDFEICIICALIVQNTNQIKETAHLGHQRLCSCQFFMITPLICCVFSINNWQGLWRWICWIGRKAEILHVLNLLFENTIIPPVAWINVSLFGGAWRGNIFCQKMWKKDLW